MVYRAYRYPYEYVPQVEKPVETPVVRLDNHDFRVPGASDSAIKEVTSVAGTEGYNFKMDACVTDGQV